MSTLNVMWFESVQDALDAASEGDRIYFPGIGARYPGSPQQPPPPAMQLAAFYQAPAGGWRIRKSLELFGDTLASVGKRLGSTLVPNDELSDVFVIEPQPGRPPPRVHFHDLLIRDRGSTTGRNGIGCDFLDPTLTIAEIKIDRVVVNKMDGAAFDLGGSEPDCVDTAYFLDSAAAECGGTAIVLENVGLASLVRSGAGSSLGGTMSAMSCGVYCQQGGFESLPDGATVPAIAQVTDCHPARFLGCHFEDFSRDGKVGLSLDGCAGNGLVGAGVFTLKSLAEGNTGGDRAIEIAGPNAGAVAVLPNRMERVNRLVDIGADVASAVVMPQFSNSNGVLYGGDIALPTTPNNGILATTHINRPAGAPGGVQFSGLLLPSGPGDAPATPQDGMLWFRTDGAGAVRVYAAGAWRSLAVPS